MGSSKSGFIRWDFQGIPTVRKFAELVNAIEGKNQPIAREEVLEELLGVGLLSRSLTGNYSLRAPIDPDYYLNPVLESRRLYFTTRDFAERYGRVFNARALLPSKESPWRITSPPWPQDWRELFMKLNGEDTLESDRREALARASEDGIFAKTG